MAQANPPDQFLWPEPLPGPDGMTPALLEGMLEAGGHAVKIAHLDSERVGTGQLGDTARFRIDYSQAAGPATIIGKFASSDATSLAVARSWSLYEREVRFYRELAARARVATPACYFAALDSEGGFVLLLEDLAPARPGDQFAGMTEDEATQGVQQAARLHATFWNQGEDANLAWLDTGAKAQPFYGPEVFRETWPAFRDRYADRLEIEHLQVCEALCEHYEAYNLPRSRPRCVTHNDYRPDNMLIDADRLTVVDWQSVALGTNAVDIAYLIGGSYDAAGRRAAEPVLIKAYLDELGAQGVSDYSRDEFEHEYRHFTFAGINVAVGAAMLVQRTERGDRMFLTMLDRHVSHVNDAGALAALTE